MVTGVVWETTAFVLADIFLWGMLGGILAGLVAATFTIWTILDLIWVPLGIAAIYYVRVAFKAQYLDEHLNLIDGPGHRGVFFFCVGLIALSWGLLIIAGFTGWFISPLFPGP
jgi:hypothetical protein